MCHHRYSIMNQILQLLNLTKLLSYNLVKLTLYIYCGYMYIILKKMLQIPVKLHKT